MYVSQTRTVQFETEQIEYILTRKRVKNINLRISLDGTIKVSAGPGVPINTIERFLKNNQKEILHTLSKFREYRENMQEIPKKKLTAQDKCMLEQVCLEVYPAFEKMGVVYPVIKYRYMTSRWGSCQPEKGIVTLNSKLVAVPKECLKYVVVHEFAHFIHPNHSRDFYHLVETIMPDYKVWKMELKKYQ